MWKKEPFVAESPGLCFSLSGIFLLFKNHDQIEDSETCEFWNYSLACTSSLRFINTTRLVDLHSPAISISYGPLEWKVEIISRSRAAGKHQPCSVGTQQVKVGQSPNTNRKSETYPNKVINFQITPIQKKKKISTTGGLWGKKPILTFPLLFAFRQDSATSSYMPGCTRYHKFGLSYMW